MINKMLDYREVQRKRLEENSDLSLGDVNTINLTMMNGGVQANVVPDKLILTFEVRKLQHQIYRVNIYSIYFIYWHISI